MCAFPCRDPMVVPIPQWPQIDQELWAANVALGDGLDDPTYAAGLRPHMLCSAAKGNGRWLAVLASRDALDASALPTDRLTPANVRAYLRALHRAGNCNNTIITRFFDLRAALRIMQPDVDTGWLTAPGGQSLIRRLPVVRRSFDVPHSKVLYDWGLDMMAQAQQRGGHIRRCTVYRNGLLIAVLASRGARIRSVAAMRLGQHVQPNGDRFRLVFEAEDIKMAKPIEYDLPRSLTAHMRRYLDVKRPALLSGQSHDWFWVGQHGEPLGLRGLEQVIRRASLARFGGAFGPHRFRHAIGTTAPVADPTRPASAAAMLGSSPAVVEEYYNLGEREIAAQRFHSSLEEQRARTRLLAERLFDQR